MKNNNNLNIKFLKQNLFNQNLETDKNFKRLARERFDEARFSNDNKEAYIKALEAYEINPSEYQYKSFAISKIDDGLIKEFEYFNLIQLVDNEINNSLEGLYKFYEQDEIYSSRYKYLKFQYCISLIQNKKYQIALDELIKFKNMYSYFDLKVMHLILALCIYLDNNKLFLDEYFKISANENILYMLPLAYDRFRKNTFDEAKKIILRIKELNKYFFDVIKEYDSIEMKEKILKTKDKYFLGTIEEAQFCFKYIGDIYLDDKEFKKFLEENKG